MSLAILIECRPPACETDKGEEKGSLTQNERGCDSSGSQGAHCNEKLQVLLRKDSEGHPVAS